MDIFSPQAKPLCLSIPVFLYLPLVLEDSENVRSDRRCCYRVYIKSQDVSLDEGVFKFIFATFHTFLFVLYSFPPRAVPVHSRLFRLKYGCVVVDTYHEWLMLLWLDINNKASTGTTEIKNNEGVTQVPLKLPFLTSFFTSFLELYPALHSAVLGSLNGFGKQWTIWTFNGDISNVKLWVYYVDKPHFLPNITH